MTQWLRPLAVVTESRDKIANVFRDLVYQGVLYLQNVIRLDGTRVRVIACMFLRNCGLPCADFYATIAQQRYLQMFYAVPNFTTVVQ
jgi:hypothetical protein